MFPLSRFRDLCTGVTPSYVRDGHLIQQTCTYLPTSLIYCFCIPREQPGRPRHMTSSRRMALEQEPKANKFEARCQTARSHQTRGEWVFFATMEELYDADQVPADDEEEVFVFFFDEDEEMTPTSRTTRKLSRKTIERRRRLEQKLMKKSSK